MILLDFPLTDINFIQADIDACTGVAGHVRAVPTFEFLKDQRVVKTVQGADAVAVSKAMALLK